MPRDETYLYYMLVAARRVMQSVMGFDQSQFDSDLEKRDSVVMQLINIGEAASRLSEDYRKRHPQVPWNKVIGMRHRIVHAYMKIDWAIVWDSALHDVPDLIRLIEPLIPPEAAV
jgi:uncharacterized protein with HEPN domain